jgi:4-alpha-glucanotransferase
VVEGTHRLLATAPSTLVSATLDDACSTLERPNQPGTLDEWPNWCLALPRSLEELEADPRPRRIAEILDRRE